MKQLPKSILALLVAFALFFNIERVDFENSGVINVSTLVYILVTIASLVTLRFRQLNSMNPAAVILFWQAVYLLSNFFLINRGVRGDLIFVYVTEVTFLSIIVLLSQKVAEHLRDFEEAVENITLSGLNRPHKALGDSLSDIQNQMYLSRRHDRPLSIIVLRTEAPELQILWNRAVKEVQDAMMSRYVASRVVRVLDQQLRRTDLVVHNEDGSFVVVCPETDGSKLRTMTERIRSSVEEQLGVAVLCGSASFPDAALTFEELLAQAEQDVSNGVGPLTIQMAETPKEPQQKSVISDPEMMVERG